MQLKATARFTPRGDLGQFISVKVVPGVVDGVNAADNLVLDEALLLVPVDTGELYASGKVIEAQDTGKTVVGGVEFTADHAGYNEFGTGIAGASSPGAGPYPYDPNWPGMPARPFLRPALDYGRQKIVEGMASSISLSLQK